MSGICSWLFAAEAENNQLRGISGLVSRLYLGFYIPRADLSIRMTKKYVTHLTSARLGLFANDKQASHHIIGKDRTTWQA